MLVITRLRALPRARFVPLASTALTQDPEPALHVPQGQRPTQDLHRVQFAQTVTTSQEVVIPAQQVKLAGTVDVPIAQPGTLHLQEHLAVVIVTHAVLGTTVLLAVVLRHALRTLGRVILGLLGQTSAQAALQERSPRRLQHLLRNVY